MDELVAEAGDRPRSGKPAFAQCFGGKFLEMDWNSSRDSIVLKKSRNRTANRLDFIPALVLPVNENCVDKHFQTHLSKGDRALERSRDVRIEVVRDSHLHDSGPIGIKPAVHKARKKVRQFVGSQFACPPNLGVPMREIL